MCSPEGMLMNGPTMTKVLKGKGYAKVLKWRGSTIANKNVDPNVGCSSICLREGVGVNLGFY